jgi:DNA polymerase/3'-5' exonuclease PolX
VICDDRRIIGIASSVVYSSSEADRSGTSGLKFDSTGITRRSDAKEFVAKSEEEVFEILDLEYIRESRNSRSSATLI